MRKMFEQKLQDALGSAHVSIETKMHSVGGDPTRKYAHSELDNKSEEELSQLFNAVDYNAIAPQMGTGDVLLLHGTELFSTAIKLVTRSWYSHVAVVLKEPSPDILQLYGLESKRDPHGLYSFESDSSTEDGREGGGTQMLPLGEWVKEMRRYYVEEKGSRFFLAWRRVHFAGREDQPQPVSSFPALPDMLRAAHGKRYENRLDSLLQSIAHHNKEEDLSAVFCSELVA
eukprot:EG_transcript_27881